MIFLAIPLYENKVWVPFMNGLLNTVHEFTGRGITVEYCFEKGTHIAMNRENLARNFLKTNCQFMLCLDSDISFTPQDILELMATDVDVVSGVYRFRTPVPEGSPTVLPYRLMDGTFIDLQSKEHLFKCEYIPGGMVLIRRKVIETMYKEHAYIFNQGFFPSNNGPISVEEDYIGEDIMFCKKWRELGGDIYVNTKVRVGHFGEFEYRPNPRINSADGENLLPPNR